MKLSLVLLAGAALVFAQPGFAQGSKASSPLELAEAVDGLAPGKWVWAPDIAPDGHVGTHVATLQKDKNGASNWVMVGVPGHEGEANHALDATALHRLRLPHGFHQKLIAQITPGTTVLVTSAPVGAHNSGTHMTLLSATGTDDVL